MTTEPIPAPPVPAQPPPPESLDDAERMSRDELQALQLARTSTSANCARLHGP